MRTANDKKKLIWAFRLGELKFYHAPYIIRKLVVNQRRVQFPTTAIQV